MSASDVVIISQPKGARTLALRASYLAICEGDKCAAHLLNANERWYGYKLAEREQARHRNKVAVTGGEVPEADESLWVFMSAPEWASELLSIYEEQTIRKALKRLVEKGFLATRSNPKKKWDRKPQWLFLRSKVQAAVDAWATPLPPIDLDPSEADAEGMPKNAVQHASEAPDKKYQDHPGLLSDASGTFIASTRDFYQSNTTGFLPRGLFSKSFTHTHGLGAGAPCVVEDLEDEKAPTETGPRTLVAQAPDGAASDEARGPGQAHPVQGEVQIQASDEPGNATGLETVPPAAPETDHWAMVAAINAALYPGVKPEHIAEDIQAKVGRAAKKLRKIGLTATAPAEILAYIKARNTWRKSITPDTLVQVSAAWQAWKLEEGQDGAVRAADAPVGETGGRNPTLVFVEGQRIRYAGCEMVVDQVMPNGTVVTDHPSIAFIPPGYLTQVEVVA